MRKIKIIFILLLFVGVFGHSQEISKVEDSKKIDNPLSVKRISFQGLVKAPEDVLRSIVQTKIGQEIDPDQLSKDIKNLYKDTGLFSDIFVDVETAEGGGLNVIFNVKESPKIEGRINIIGNKNVEKPAIYTRNIAKFNNDSLIENENIYIPGMTNGENQMIQWSFEKIP